jgi:cation diffusion facilitator CzcD-associated flavoprotein CzcO
VASGKNSPPVERGTAVPVGRALPDEVEVAIVGAGFGGLGTAIRLKEAGIGDFVVIEREAGVGGTWRVNTYPGCQCDVPSNLYSFSFAPKPDWTRSYPEGPQIRAYLEDCAERFGVLPHVHLATEMTAAAWDAEAGRWRVETSRGPVMARALVAAPGLLSEPSTPAIPGLAEFRGTVFHTSRWDHGHDLRGERVALIGTGATAIQVGPRIAPLTSRLHVFQRTPPWIIPHPDRGVPAPLRRLYARVPALQRAARGGVYALREYIAAGMTRNQRLLATMRATALAQLRLQVRDPALRARVTPGYEFGCKRILLSNEWYPTLTAPGTELVTAPIEAVRERSVLTADGREREVDSIVLATGFKAADPAIAHRLRGLDGRLLSEVWEPRAEAYLGTVVAGFPNLFLLYGPNLNLAHTSIVYMLESQIAYVMQALALLRRGTRSLQVRTAVQAAYNERLRGMLAGTVWDTGGCRSWYLDAHGRDSVMWPDFTFRYRDLTRHLDPSDFELESEPASVA